jgi:hypothetical protein
MFMIPRTSILRLVLAQFRCERIWTDSNTRWLWRMITTNVCFF